MYARTSSAKFAALRNLRRWRRWAIHGIIPALLMLIGSSLVEAQGPATQSDWSGGPGVSGPVAQWGNLFASSNGIAWQPIAGQISSSSIPLDTPVQMIMAGDATHPNSVAIGDLNGDGKANVISTVPVYDVFGDLGGVYWWQLDNEGVWTQHTVDDDFYGAIYVDTVDIDLDGDLDIIGAAYYGVADPPPPDGLAINGRFAWFENLNGDASHWQQHLVGELFNGASHIDAADFDGDGDIDLVGASQLTDGINKQDADIVWFENLDGAGQDWAQHGIDDDLPNAGEAHAADLDGDGDMDIVGANSAQFGASNFHWWENVEGDATVWVKREIPFQFLGQGYLDVGDIDNDGDLDLIGGGFNSGALRFWQNLDGTGLNWQAWAVPGIAGGRRIELADLDGDGDLDALVANRNGSIWGGAWRIENLDGVGSSWQLTSLDFLIPSTRPWIAAGDVNDDGKLDAVVCHDGAYGDGTQQLSWWNITEFDTASNGELLSSILDGGDEADWTSMTWEVDLPEATEIAVQVRASDDPDNLGEFVTVPESGASLSDLIDTNAGYFQYRLRLSTDDPECSPVMTEIAVHSAATGDLNGDGVIGAADLAILLAGWGPCPAEGECPADLNGDGVVGAADLAMLLAAWS